jgi:hypothetical protein
MIFAPMVRCKAENPEDDERSLPTAVTTKSTNRLEIAGKSRRCDLVLISPESIRDIHKDF